MMNENTREAKAINGQELKPIEAGVTGLDEEQLAEVAGGGSHGNSVTYLQGQPWLQLQEKILVWMELVRQVQNMQM